MNTLDRLMFSIKNWSQKEVVQSNNGEIKSNGFATRFFATRLATIGCIPLEILSSLQNLIKLCLVSFGCAAKLPIKTTMICIKSKELKKLDKKLPSVNDIYNTAYKVAAYSAEIIITGTYGLWNPAGNVRLHEKMIDTFKNDQSLKESLKNKNINEKGKSVTASEKNDGANLGDGEEEEEEAAIGDLPIGKKMRPDSSNLDDRDNKDNVSNESEERTSIDVETPISHSKKGNCILY